MEQQSGIFFFLISGLDLMENVKGGRHKLLESQYLPLTHRTPGSVLGEAYQASYNSCLPRWLPQTSEIQRHPSVPWTAHHSLSLKVGEVWQPWAPRIPLPPLTLHPSWRLPAQCPELGFPGFPQHSSRTSERCFCWLWEMPGVVPGGYIFI